MKLLLILLILMNGGCSSPSSGSSMKHPLGGDGAYYILSDKGELFPMAVKPGKEAELLRKLRILAHIEKKAHDELEPGTTVSFIPGYSYSFVWVESTNPLKEHSFFVRGRTLGGYTAYRFDADKYFESSSWKKPEQALKGNIEETVDRYMSNIGTEDYLPER